MSPRPHVVRFQKRRRYGEWQPGANLAAPIDALDSFYLARALSILHGITEPAGALTPQQARDVVAWHERHTNPPPRAPFWRRAIAFIPGLGPNQRSHA